MKALEDKLLKRLDRPSCAWTKADLGEIRKLGRPRLKRVGLKKAA